MATGPRQCWTAWLHRGGRGSQSRRYTRRSNKLQSTCAGPRRAQNSTPNTYDLGARSLRRRDSELRKRRELKISKPFFGRRIVMCAVLKESVH